MNGCVVLLDNGKQMHFPNAEYWTKSSGRLKLKDSQYGSMIALFNWDNVVCVHESENVTIDRGNTNAA